MRSDRQALGCHSPLPLTDCTKGWAGGHAMGFARVKTKDGGSADDETTHFARRHNPPYFGQCHALCTLPITQHLTEPCLLYCEKPQGFCFSGGYSSLRES